MTEFGYLRKSTADETGSLDQQRRKIAARVDDPDRIVWVEDEAVSGLFVPLAERPGGVWMLEQLRRGDRVNVARLDRLGRTVRDLSGLMDQFRALGVDLQIIDLGIDTSTVMGRVFFHIVAALAEGEAEQIGERRRANLAGYRIEGRWTHGRAPYGWTVVDNPDGYGKVLRPDPEVAPALADQITRIIAGRSQADAARELGIPRTQIFKTLHNPRLAGYQYHEGKAIIRDGVPYVVPEQAIVSEATYRDLQDYLARDVPKVWTRTGGYGAALRCSVCGDRLYLSRSNTPVYRCRKAKDHGEAEAASVSVKVADARIEEMIYEFRGCEYVTVRTVLDDTDRRNAIASATHRLEAAQAAYANAETEAEEENALDALRAAKAALRAAEATPESERQETTVVGTLGEAWDAADDTERTRLLTAFGGVTVHGGRGLDPEDKLTADWEHVAGTIVSAPELLRLVEHPDTGIEFRPTAQLADLARS